MFVSFQRSFLCVFLGFLAALFFTIGFGWPHNGLIALSMVGLCTAAFAGSLHLLARRYEARLEKRIASNAAARWSVILNDIKLGTLTDAEYATAILRAFRDPRVAGEQLDNVCRVAWRSLGKLFVLIPFVLFWAEAILMLSSPDAFAVMVHQLQQADAATFTAAMKILFQVAALMSAMTLLLGSAAFGYDIGVRDCYSEGTNRELRRIFNSAATGDIRLVPELPACECRTTD